MQLLKSIHRRLASLDAWMIVFLILLSIYVLPIWVFQYFPSQDGPSHIYNAFILRHYDNPEYVFDQFYGVRKTPIPNWASHAIMMLLMYVVPPLVAEKLLLTGYIVLMAGGALYLLNAVEKGRTPLVFLVFPYIYYHLLLIGFYNSSLSLAFLMPVIGYWWKHYDTFRFKHAGVLACFLIAMYFCHMVYLVLALFSIVVFSVLRLIPRFAQWRQSLLSALCTLPAVVLMLYYLTGWGSERSGSGEIGGLWRAFIRNESLAHYSESQMIFARLVMLVWVALVVYTIIRQHLFTKNWRWGLRGNTKLYFLLLSAAFFGIYLIAPGGMAGGWVIKGRLVFVPLLILIPWLSWEMPRVARGVVGGALALLAAAYVVHGSYYHRHLSDQVAVFNSGIDVVERNSVLLPLSFDASAGAWRIGVVFHTAGYYGVEKGCIELGNYEAGLTNYFPTYFKPEIHRPMNRQIEGSPASVDIGEYAEDIDYILTWNLPSGSGIEAHILAYYQLIREAGYLKIFKRAQWEREPLAPITDKTLVAWVSLDNLEQRGSGVLTLEQFDLFDAIVFGEVKPQTWMAGSDTFKRTHTVQDGWPEETASPDELIQIAIAYEGTQVSLYRNGKPIASHTVDKAFVFRSGMEVLIGVRHLARAAGPNSHFAGSVEEARIYDRGLDPATIAALTPDAPSSVPPLARWSFEDGTPRDEMGFFGEGQLRGGATIRDGKLMLDGKDDYMITPPKFGPLLRAED